MYSGNTFMKKRIFFSVIISVFGLWAPFAAFGQSAVANGFDVSPSSLNSGGSATFSWRTSYSSGANLLLPCAAGVKYKETNDTVIACDQKIKLAATDKKSVKIVNTSGASVTVSPVLIPLNMDGTENTAELKKITLTVATSPAPISEFSATTTVIASGAAVAFNWKAPDVDRLNMKMSCSSDILPKVVGDERPRVPCEQPIFLYDLGESGTQSFTLESSSLEPVKVTFTLLPKISLTGSFDGTHAKSIEMTVLAASQSRNPVITSYFVDPLTLRTEERAAVSWNVIYGAGVNFQLKCSPGITATTSKSGAEVFECGRGNMFGSILDPVGAFSMTFHNALKSPQSVDLVLVPAIGAAEYDASRARTMHLVVLGNAYGVTALASTSPVLPVGPVASTTPKKTIPPVAPAGGLFQKPLAYGLKNSQDVTELQKILKAEGVYDGPITGNFLSLTREGVRKFQKKYGLDQVGNVGPLTRKKLNEIISGGGR
ncbi:MAG: hypothetical protein A3C11_01370 [Candidatus Sungbacteria bacterium RIFCSPHIGHO2_02_FULL_49_12]|uniref:Peptidoglycan binding-like domain-containing protein n=1 Tax=Candidatus Sungbacteria bacterium RIFCSPHIGHO2_02_FULL_49_12 TaxID=1802271 RepID=A0A1G2KNP0_9BACT|nr:MAG: hypothetical protein A3C11_01370 [Candidatus Sungbacteria bacterium RIFCSPHIGHO2_02_FULL_49_12]